MSVKEKLVELLGNIYLPMMCGPDTIGEYRIPHKFKKEIASHLIAHGVTVQEWISVKDMPFEEYEYKTVLYYDGKNVDPCLVLNGKFIDIYTDCGRYIDGVTHWMPLPQPPKGE